MQKPPGFDPQPLDDSESLFWRVGEPQASVRLVLLCMVGDRERARRCGSVVRHGAKDSPANATVATDSQMMSGP